MEISLSNSLSKVLNNSELRVLANEKDQILLEIDKVKNDLRDAYQNLDYVVDALMIDYYTYQIKAYETRFEYLIKLAKELGVNDIKISI